MSASRGRVLVAGGAGFLGSHLCERLLNDGFEIVCVDNYVTGDPANLRHFLDDDRFSSHRIDVSDQLPSLGACSHVLHLASPAAPTDYRRYPVPTLRAGSIGTLNLLDYASRVDARFLLASTSEVYGDPQVHPQPEDYWGHVNPVGPRSVYDEAKRFAEAATAAYARSGLSAAIVRVFNTFGPRMRRDDGRAVPSFVEAALAGTDLVIEGDGTHTRSFCYVDDLIDGLLRVLFSEWGPQPINLGGANEVTVLDVAQLVLTLADSRSRIVHVAETIDDPRRRRPDLSLAAGVFGWAPRISMEEGLGRMIDWRRLTTGASSMGQVPCTLNLEGF